MTLTDMYVFELYVLPGILLLFLIFWSSVRDIRREHVSNHRPLTSFITSLHGREKIRWFPCVTTMRIYAVLYTPSVATTCTTTIHHHHSPPRKHNYAASHKTSSSYCLWPPALNPGSAAHNTPRCCVNPSIRSLTKSCWSCVVDHINLTA